MRHKIFLILILDFNSKIRSKPNHTNQAIKILFFSFDFAFTHSTNAIVQCDDKMFACRNENEKQNEKKYIPNFTIFRVLRLECARSSCWMSKEVREPVVFVASGTLRKHFLLSQIFNTYKQNVHNFVFFLCFLQWFRCYTLCFSVFSSFFVGFLFCHFILRK